MSALAHYLEEQGIPTVTIGLIRPQVERTRPPRALWVPFELGRPFGPPGEAAFQRRVVVAALRLLERRDGPTLIEDFPDDDPRAIPDPAWHPPPAAGPEGRLADEIRLLDGCYRRAVARRGRTTVGLSGLGIAAAADYVAAWLDRTTPPSPVAGMSPPLALRFAVDDLKAYGLEAALADGSRPSSRQQTDWFWSRTATAAAIRAVRAAHLASADDRLRLIAGNFLVPARYLVAG